MKKYSERKTSSERAFSNKDSSKRLSIKDVKSLLESYCEEKRVKLPVNDIVRYIEPGTHYTSKRWVFTNKVKGQTEDIGDDQEVNYTI